MTNREFLTAVSALDNADLAAFATAALAKMDAANEKRKNTPSKTQIENAPLLDQIVNEILGVEPKTASEVAEVLGVKVQKASALLRALVADGRAVATDGKIPKKGTVKLYTLAE